MASLLTGTYHLGSKKNVPQPLEWRGCETVAQSVGNDRSDCVTSQTIQVVAAFGAAKHLKFIGCGVGDVEQNRDKSNPHCPTIFGLFNRHPFMLRVKGWRRCAGVV